MSRTPPPRTATQKAAHARARHLRRDIITALQTATDDAGLRRRALCRVAGIGPNTFVALERDDREPSIEVLARLAAALGGELSLRFHPGTGPLVRDHLQAAMVQALVRGLGVGWTAQLEVPVWAPSRGSIDVVLRHVDGSLVACEVHSELRRLEQQIRWASEKAAALGMQRSGSVGGQASASTLLLLRVTPTNIAIVERYAELLRAAYPAGHRSALAALRGQGRWPGSAIVWMDIRGGVAHVRERMPRGVPRW